MVLVLLSRLLPGMDQPVAAQTVPASLPAAPAGWPSTLQLGMSDKAGGAEFMRATAPFGLRYQYLAGGVNTGKGWATWNRDGTFASRYIQESINQGVTPVFTYYMLLQSAPAAGSDEGAKDYSNLQDAATMTAYYNDLKLFFQRAGAFSGTMVVLHV